ncbi:hypothetical protein JCM10450v2_008085 [Rhodotorula kratochvilovae]
MGRPSRPSTGSSATDPPAQYASRPPASPSSAGTDAPDDTVPEILVSPASPLSPAGPLAARSSAQDEGDDGAETRDAGGAPGEDGAAGQGRTAAQGRGGWDEEAGPPPSLVPAGAAGEEARSVPPPAPAPASAATTATPASAAPAAPVPPPPSEARTFFSSLSSALPSVSLPSFTLNLSSLLPAKLPGAPTMQPYTGAESSDDEEGEKGEGARRRRRDSRGVGGARGGEEQGRRSMDLRIEEATGGPSLVSDTPAPSTPSSSSVGASSSPAKPAFAALARTPSSAFVAASNEGRVHPLTLHAVARRDSEREAIQLVRARKETERRRESTAEGMGASGSDGDRPALLRKQSWTAAAARVTGGGRSESPAELSEEERASAGGRRRGHGRGSGSGSLGLGFVGEEDAHPPRQDSTSTVRASTTTSGSSSAPHTRQSTASTSSDHARPSPLGFAAGDVPPSRARNVSTASTLSLADSTAQKKDKKKGAFRSLFSRPRTASQASAIATPAVPATPPPPGIPRGTTPPLSAASASGGFPGLAVESPVLERGGSKGEKIVRPKVRAKGKSTKEFGSLFLAQELSISTSSTSTLRDDVDSLHSSAPPAPDNASQHSRTTAPAQDDEPGAKKRKAVWAVKFSEDGRYLAVGGKDGVVRVWEVLATPEDRDAALYPSGSPDGFTPGAPDSPSGSRTFPQPSTPSTIPPTPSSTAPSGSGRKKASAPPKAPACVMPVFGSRPVREFRGHEADVLDLSWSKNNFLLSSSMDKTVRLWHVSRSECLCAFQHLDFVTSIAFHPKDDRFFLSGSLDCKLRLWNIPEKRVHIWTELPELITAVSFTRDGKLAIAGTFVGAVMFFLVETFQYHSQVTAKSTRGKNSKGKKVTSLTPFPLPSSTGERLLVTTNDSRLRLYHTADKIVETKYAGHENTSSQIRASFSDDGRWIISGSEDRNVFIWDSGLDPREDGGYHLRKKHKESPHEYFPMAAHIVTAAVFAPTMTRTHLAAAADPIFADGHTHMAPLERTLSGASLGLVGVETRNTTISSLEVPGMLVPATSIDGLANAAAGGARDAIIVVADDETGVISIFRNSKIPLAALPADSSLKRDRSKRWSRATDPAR